MKVGILAVQGAFIEHEHMFQELGCRVAELRSASDIVGLDALVLPGGESTVQGKLVRELGMFDGLKKLIEQGIPVLATCAGTILLAKKICNDDKVHFQTLPVTVRRNAYGRQLGSFSTVSDFGKMNNVPMTFIRAPVIMEAESGVEILSAVDGKIVAVEYKNQIGLSFHPELDRDTRIIEYFIKKC